MYLRVLMDVVKRWMETVMTGRPYVFQQDGAPAHTSHFKNWLSDNVDMFWFQGILASQQSRFKSLRILNMERS